MTTRMRRKTGAASGQLVMFMPLPADPVHCPKCGWISTRESADGRRRCHGCGWEGATADTVPLRMLRKGAPG